MSSVDITMVSTFIFAGIIGGIGLLYLKKQWKYSNLPPGPKGLPFVGNAFQQDPERPEFTWFKWAEQYGEICTMWNFGKPAILCNGFDVCWEMLVKKSKEFAGRPQQYVIKFITDDGNDITFMDFNQSWAHQKKVFMTGLKMYGEGIKRLEDLMVNILAELVEDMEATKGQAFDPQKYIELALANTLSLLLFGTKFESSDPDFSALMEYIAQSQVLLSQSLYSFAYDACPWLHYLPLPFSRLIDQYVDGFMKGWIPRHVQKARVNYDKNNCSCVMDSFIRQHEQDVAAGIDHPIEEHHLVTLAHDFIVGALLTTTPVLTALFAILTAKPDIQTKAREEVDRVLDGHWPTLKDRESMPYLHAMLEELMRYVVIGPGGLPHKATEDSTLCGYSIPKDTMVLCNHWFLCHDPNFWREPYTFKPERFLDSNGELLPIDHPNRTRILIFGANRRVCPGEQLAKNRIFFITTSLLQKFIFKPVAEDQLPNYDPRTYKFRGTLMPQPYKLRAVPRI